MDWITGTIEAIGIVIFCIWLVVPIREFREIFLRMKSQPPDAQEAEAAFPVIQKDGEDQS